MDEYIKKKDVIDLIMSQPVDAHYPSWYADLVSKIQDCDSDVVLVAHGQWTESKEHFYLNNGCKEWTNFYCSECDAPNNSPTDYCPNCGAKMDGVADG